MCLKKDPLYRASWVKERVEAKENSCLLVSKCTVDDEAAVVRPPKDSVRPPVIIWMVCYLESPLLIRFALIFRHRALVAVQHSKSSFLRLILIRSLLLSQMRRQRKRLSDHGPSAVLMTFRLPSNIPVLCVGITGEACGVVLRL